MKITNQKFKVEGKEVLFRRPTAKDSVGILKLVDSLYREKAMIGVNEKPKINDVKDGLAKKLLGIKNKKVVYFVVEIDKQIKGRAIIKVDRDSCQSHVGSLAMHIEKEIRGKGIGDKLLKAIIKEAKKVLKIKILALEVVAGNEKALKLYRKNEFKKTGMLKGGINYFGKLVDDVYMAKYL